MKLILKIFQVGCGDCISIHFDDLLNRYYNVIIDSGYVGTYQRTLHREVTQLVSSQQSIDLFVVTHTDNDHIGGMKALLKNFKTDFFDTFWFNWVPDRPSPFILEPSRKASGIRQAIDLRNRLINEKKLNSVPIVASTEKQIGNALITVLSPDTASYYAMKENWHKEEEERFAHLRRVAAAAKSSDYSAPVEVLLKIKFREDDTVENGSSIAFLFEWEGWRCLFLADSHPSVVEESLRKMGYSAQNPLKVDLVKVSHHGSAGNTKKELLELIKCQTFVISANGTNRDYLPKKEALARIVAYTHREEGSPINFLFNYDNPSLRSIFTSDECRQYGINCYYPLPGTNAYEHVVERPTC